jgi:glycopeptide antibiotics resistance protein
MNFESFHFIWDVINEPGGGLMVGVIIAIMPFGMLLLYWVHRRRLQPIVVWLILSILAFGGSQLFHENRTPDQRLQLAIFEPITCALGTWVLFRVTSPKNRRDQPAADDTDAHR